MEEGATPGSWCPAQTAYSACREHGTVHSPANKCTCRPTMTFIYLPSIRSAAFCAAIIYLIS